MHLKIHPVSSCVCIFVLCHIFICSSVYLSYEQVACQKSLFLRHFLTDLCCSQITIEGKEEREGKEIFLFSSGEKY